MNDIQKKEIHRLMIARRKTLGSANKLATFLDISTSYVSQMLNEMWDAISDDTWAKVGAALGYKKNKWVVVDSLELLATLPGT